MIPSLTSLQTFTDGLYTNIAKHLPKIVRESTATVQALAVHFAETNDPAAREAYHKLKGRSNTIINLAKAMLADPMIGKEAQDAIYTAFPALKPVDKTKDAAANAKEGNAAAFSIAASLEASTEVTAGAAA